MDCELKKFNIDGNEGVRDDWMTESIGILSFNKSKKIAKNVQPTLYSSVYD